MATQSSVLAWRIPGTVEPGGLPSMGSHRVGRDWCDLAAVQQTLNLGMVPSHRDSYEHLIKVCGIRESSIYWFVDTSVGVGQSLLSLSSFQASKGAWKMHPEQKDKDAWHTEDSNKPGTGDPVCFPFFPFSSLLGALMLINRGSIFQTFFLLLYLQKFLS